MIFFLEKSTQNLAKRSPDSCCCHMQKTRGFLGDCVDIQRKWRLHIHEGASHDGGIRTSRNGKIITNVLVASETSQTLLGEFFFWSRYYIFKSIWMCKCCLPVPLEIRYRPSYEGPFIRQEYIEFYTPICTDINVLQYMYMYMYIHISVVEMKQLYTTMSKFIAFSNSFCPPMPLGKTFPTKKKSPGVWDGTFGCPSSAKKKGGCLLQMQRWGPGKSPPFLDQETYIGGGVPGCL